MNEQMNDSFRLLLSVALGVGILFLLFSLPGAWATPSQNPHRQTIPTPPIECDDAGDCPGDCTYCEGDVVVLEDWDCYDGNCGHENSNVEDCNDQDGWYCSGDVREYRDYTCSHGACTYQVTQSEDCAAKPGEWKPYTEGCPEGYECQAYYKYTCSDGSCVLKDTPEQRKKRCEGYAAWVADPVYPDTGEFALTETDLLIPGRGFDYQFGRSYSSQGERQSPLGYNWDHNYNIYLTRPSTDTLIMSNGPAEIIAYYALGDGTYRSTLNYYSVITENDDGTWTSRTPDGLSAYFVPFDGSATAGKLARIVDRNGNTLCFTYDDSGRLVAVMDTLGRTISYQYDLAGHLTAIVDFLGRRDRSCFLCL